MSISAFLFDLDGTLVDSAQDLANAVNRLRGELQLAPLADSVALSYVGDGATKLVQRALGPEIYQPQHLTLFLRLYHQQLIVHSRVYPGIRDFLHHHRHRPLAVVSNKPYQLAIELLQGLDLASPFQLILGGDSLEHKKPHPLPLQHAAAELGVAPEQCVMIGDHHTDLYGAAAAGMRSCFCRYGFGRADDAPSTWQIDSACDLIKIFP